MTYIFWISLTLLVYHIVLYPILINIISRFCKDKEVSQCKNTPSIVVLCPAFNEEDVIAEKIESFIALDYPKDKIKILVISDDSEDNTNSIVEKYALQHSNVSLAVQKPRRGKPSGHNMVEPTLDCDYVLSTDANSLFRPDAIKHLVNKIEDDEKTGLVAGQLRYFAKDGNSSGEGLYWKYENAIRDSESKTKSIIVANGSIFLIKRELFTQIHPSSVDDYERTLITLQKGYNAKYEPKAIVEEEVSEENKDEFKRKIRIISREWFATFRHASLLNPFSNPYASFSLISHKILRWLFFLFVIGMFVSNAFLVEFKVSFFTIVFLLQVIFYGIGSLDLAISNKSPLKKLTKLPGYFVVMFLCSILAFNRFLTGKQVATWSTLRS